MENNSNLLSDIGNMARNAALYLAHCKQRRKNEALRAIAAAIDASANRARILQANEQDCQLAAQNQLDDAMLDRLQLNDKRLDAMIAGIEQVATLDDPVGEITTLRENKKGLQVGRMRVPLGVVGMIYESRPNVTADAAALCLKSGNAVILRGGSEALNSNCAIIDSINEGLQKVNFLSACIQLITSADRAYVTAMLQAKQYIDVIIPRGGKGLINLVSENAQMPVIKHLEGVCHLYVDKNCDLELALRIADNGKTYRYGICGATETLLVHSEIAAKFLPEIARIYRQKNVEIRGCELCCDYIDNVKLAQEEDWYSEYLAPIIAIKIVANDEEAIAHIAKYGSAHTDSIATNDIKTAQKFMLRVDSASVMLNTPTCFADGYEYGLGAEIGISTNKLHWRGPVGLEGLTTQKFIVISDGVTR